MNIYDNNKELLAALGITGEFSTDFEVRKAILTALGGDASNVNSIYEADIKILDIYKNGGGAGGGDCSELEAQIQALEAEVAALETENNTLEASNTQLESQIASISTLSVTENGTYTPEAGILGWNNVSVNVAGSGGSAELDLTGKTSLLSLFSDCKNLVEVPKMITSDSTNFSYMFAGCKNLTTIPLLDTSKGTYFTGMFNDCSSLTTIPPLNTSNGTYFDNMFSYCKNLTTIPQLNTSNGTNFGTMFYKCSKLTTITQLDVSKGTNFSYTFAYCSLLQNIQFTGSINTSIDFSPCKSLSYDSVKSILTACSNTTNTSAKTLGFNRTLTDQNGELTALVADCTSKGWTISGLTLN